ncbi:MAG: DUF4175 family protein [bacterium]
MKNSNWQSLTLIHQLFRRHHARRLLELGIRLVAGGLLAFQLFFWISGWFSLGYRGINGLFVLSTGIFVYYLGCFLIHWWREGLRLTPYFQRWERQHREASNRASLLVYAEREAEEIQRLGYSRELIQADDQWLARYIQSVLARDRTVVSHRQLLFLLAVTISFLVFFILPQSRWAEDWGWISQNLWIYAPPEQEITLQVPEVLIIERGKSLTLVAHSSVCLDGPAAVHVWNGADWQSCPAKRKEKALTYALPAVTRETGYFFSVGNALSNKGRVTPLDPPTLTRGSSTVTPPEYTGLPGETIETLRPLSVPEGSRIVIEAEASSELKSAEMIFNDQTIPTRWNGKNLAAGFEPARTGEWYLQMEDVHGLTAVSRRYRVNLIPDATPTVEIVEPKPVTDVPDNLVLRVKLHARDDYRVDRILTHMQLNREETTIRTVPIWTYSPLEAQNVGSATELYVTFDWNMTDLGLFPGDEMTYSVEVFDNDALHGSKSARSKPYLLRYPTLMDMLHRLDELEQSQTEKLSTLVKDQKQITGDAQKTLEKIAEKRKDLSPEQPGKPSDWQEKKDLQDIKKRQEQLTEEARKIEEQLGEYRKQAEEAMAKEEEKQQGFTPETLEKIQKIQELMSGLLDKDSQSLLQKISDTMEKMSEQISDQELKDLAFSFQDYDQQLERTLNMLENAFQARQLEGLKEMANELARRQDHLERETQKLAEKKEQQQNAPASQSEQERQAQQDDLNSAEKALAQRQRQLEEDAQQFLDKMQEMKEKLQEQSPELAQKLEQLRQAALDQGLPAELSQASRQLEQQNTQLAQAHQKNAQKQLRALSDQLQQSMAGMQGMELTMDTQAITRLMRQGLFLSSQMESLTESPLGQSEGVQALRRAQAFEREAGRILAAWREMAQTNPFMNREVEILLRQSGERLQRAIAAGKGTRWVGLHETRQAMIALNRAIHQMMMDMQNMMQQMAQSQAQGMQQQMQQLISQQQSVQQMLQQLRQMGQEGEEALKQLREMAKQQAQIRNEIEKMMQQYRHAQQLRNQLEGIYQEMKEAEKLLQEGVNDQRMDEKQRRIMTRMLEAGTMQEEDDLGEDRQEEVAKTGLDAQSPEGPFPVSLPEKVRRMVERPAGEAIPFQYQEAIKNYYIRLSEAFAR